MIAHVRSQYPSPFIVDFMTINFKQNKKLDLLKLSLLYIDERWGTRQKYEKHCRIVKTYRLENHVKVSLKFL